MKDSYRNIQRLTSLRTMMDSEEQNKKTVSFEKQEVATVALKVDHALFGTGDRRKTEKQLLSEVKQLAQFLNEAKPPFNKDAEVIIKSENVKSREYTQQMERMRYKSRTPEYDPCDPEYQKSYAVKRDRLRSSIIDLKVLSSSMKVNQLDPPKAYHAQPSKLQESLKNEMEQVRKSITRSAELAARKREDTKTRLADNRAKD